MLLRDLVRVEVEGGDKRESLRREGAGIAQLGVANGGYCTTMIRSTVISPLKGNTVRLSPGRPLHHDDTSRSEAGDKCQEQVPNFILA